MPVSQLGRALPATLLTTVLAGAAACSNGSPSFSRKHLGASDLSSAVTATGKSGPHPFHVEVTGKAGSLAWTYHGNGAVNIAAGTGSEEQVTASGKRYQANSNPAPTQVPVVAMVFSPSAIYWQPWGVTKQALASASKGGKATWISLSASDTASAGSGGQKILVLAASLADPFVYLDILRSGAGSATFVRSATVGSKPARIYEVSISASRTASVVPGLYSGLIQLLGSAAGNSTLTLDVWIASDGSIAQVVYGSGGGSPGGPIGSPAAGGTGNSQGKPTVHATVSFAGKGVPPSAAISSPPASKDVISLASLVNGASATPESAQTTESCAEDAADHGTDAGKCTSTTTSGG